MFRGSNGIQPFSYNLQLSNQIQMTQKEHSSRTQKQLAMPLKQHGQKHQMHQVFEAPTGTLKPSLFRTPSSEEQEEYVFPINHLALTVDEKKKRRKSNRRNSVFSAKKVFYDSSSQNEEDQDITKAKTRKLTMPAGEQDEQLLFIFPTTPRLQPDDTHLNSGQKINQSKQIDSRIKTQKQEQTFEAITIDRQQLLFFQSEGEQTKEQKKQPISQIEMPQQSQISIQYCNNRDSYENQMEGSILSPLNQMLKEQASLTTSILDLQVCKERTSFLFQSLPYGSRMVFEAMVENNIFQREYTFWLGGYSNKCLLMQAKKSIKLLEDYYLINQYVQEMRCYSFISKLQSNFNRKQFVLTNQQENTTKIDKQIYADFNVCSIANKPKMFINLPSFDKQTRQQSSIKMGNNPNILKSLLKIGESNITYFNSCVFDQHFESQFMHQQRMIKTNKTVALTDSFGKVKLYIGKTQSKKYKIVAGSGISPLIIFAVFIVLIES